MALRVWLLLAMVALATVAQAVPLVSIDSATDQWGVAAHYGHDHGDADAVLSGTCDGPLGECIGEEEEMMMESEISRRGLLAQQRQNFIGYGALKKNKVPCNRRGHSYYNCGRRGKVNPYRRTCTVITQCKRFTN